MDHDHESTDTCTTTDKPHTTVRSAIKNSWKSVGKPNSWSPSFHWWRSPSNTLVIPWLFGVSCDFVVWSLVMCWSGLLIVGIYTVDWHDLLLSNTVLSVAAEHTFIDFEHVFEYAFVCFDTRSPHASSLALPPPHFPTHPLTSSGKWMNTSEN